MAKKTFTYTRRALRRVKGAMLRQDFLNFVDGVEFGLDSRKPALAAKCVKDLVTTTFVLNRTVTPKVAVVILDGILADARRHRIQTGNILLKANNKKCKFGSPLGKGGRCETEKGSTCWGRVGGGCGGTSGFGFAWSKVSVK